MCRLIMLKLTRYQAAETISASATYIVGKHVATPSRNNIPDTDRGKNS